MNKYLSLLKYELRTIAREPINLYLCLFPVILLILSSFVFPLIFTAIDPLQETMLKVMMLFLLVILLSFGAFFLGAMATFLLLEQKDENTIHSIAVTPVGASGYLKFKMTYIYVLSVLGNMIILMGTKLLAGDKYTIMGISLFGRLCFVDVVLFSLVNGLLVPALGLLQSAFARNKVEGFAFIKGTGMLALVPVLMVLDTFQGSLQYLLGIFPNFWVIRGMLVKLMPIEYGANLGYPAYLLIGALYNGLLLVLSYRFFLKKVQY